MRNNQNGPRSLQEAIIYFADADRCLKYVAARRWPNGVHCPICGASEPSFLAKRRIWQCKAHHDKRQFSIKTGSIFEDSPIRLDKWMVAVWLVVNCKNGISSYEVARDLRVTQKTAWFMLHRIRLAMQTGSFFKKLGGSGSEVEVDETFIGGAARFMHRDKHRRRITETGTKDKTAVVGVLERGGEVRTAVVPNRRKHHLQKHIQEHVETGGAVYTDALMSYMGLEHRGYAHQVIDHATSYVNGRVHTNGLENFWSLLKRGLKGTYVCVEPFHLFRYLDEQSFRYNNRTTKAKPMDDADRFSLAVSQIAGKRLTFDQLTGKTQDAQTASF